jgi:prolipoprotein diacylglyceryltransferase
MDELSTLGSAAQFHPGYALTVLLGFALVLGFPLTKHMKESRDRKRYYILQGITLIGAALGAKLAVLMGDALWPLEHFDDWMALVFSGRSIIGALLVGFLFAEAAKPLMAYKMPPNDRFAVVLPFSIGIGRFGCYLAGCCRGIPYDGPLTITYADGIARHPIAFYEMAFQFAVGLLLLHLYRRKILFGRLFALYLILYGLFRFQMEYLRVTEKAFFDYSAYQWFALAAVAAGCIAFAVRSVKQPPTWAAMRAQT